MARKPRIHVPGAFYHVMARGNRKQDVFQDDDDYHTYLRLVKKYSQRYGVEVHGYVLMPNHVHFLLRVGDIPLAKFMQGVQQSYTQIYNKRHDQVGHLFQGRFKSLLVDKDAYLLELIRYIHLNPVKAGLVNDPRSYRWSSQWNYFHTREEDWVKTGFIKSILAQYGGTVVDDYQLVPDSVPGNDASIQKENVQRQLQDVAHLKLDLDALLSVVSEFTGVAPQLVAGSGRVKQALEARRLLVYAACRWGRYSLAEVAGFLNRTESTISKSLHWVEDNLGALGEDTLPRLRQKLQGSGLS
jgi:REP element-mobilizing transposase RayT